MAQSNGHILVVEDDPALAGMIVNLLLAEHMRWMDLTPASATAWPRLPRISPTARSSICITPAEARAC